MRSISFNISNSQYSFRLQLHSLPGWQRLPERMQAVSSLGFQPVKLAIVPPTLSDNSTKNIGNSAPER